VFVLASSLLYASAVVYFTHPSHSTNHYGILDEAWKKDGFCIQNKDVPFWSSFDTCLYVDIIFSIVLGVMYLCWKNTPGMQTSSEIVPMVILGTLGHGFAHGAMAAKFRDGTYQVEQSEQMEIPPFWQLVMFIVLFWFPLLKASMPKLDNVSVLVLSVVVTYGPILAGGLKKELGFAYIQTILSMAFHFSQLTLPPNEKQRREYMTLPVAALPPVLVSWNEAFFCSSFFRAMGGHVLYDASIIVAYIAYYLDCHRFYTSNISTKEKTT
jgi:hypothetical protein